MLTMEQRNNRALQIEGLKNRLLQYEQLTLRELPEDLAKEVRSYRIIGPFTSNGLEHVPAIINRITWAIYYLTNPTFPEKQPIQPAPIPPQRPGAAPQIPQRPAPEMPIPVTKAPAAKPTPPSTTIDFGPFDPRASA